MENAFFTKAPSPLLDAADAVDAPFVNTDDKPVPAALSVYILTSSDAISPAPAITSEVASCPTLFPAMLN